MSKFLFMAVFLAFLISLSYAVYADCNESWSCGDWGGCSNSLQTRTCTDANNCNTTTGQPALNQSCASCTESWTCGSWTVCNAGHQTKVCSDANNCNTTINQPALSQSCNCTQNWSCGDWGPCKNRRELRDCSDDNNCGNLSGQPVTNQSCSGDCTEVWNCGIWFACINGQQKRYCTDSNDCGTTISRPEITRSCGENNTDNNTNGSNNKFIPWQKRNQSECPDGCKCAGAVVSCLTEDGKTMTITAGNSGKTITIVVNKSEVETDLNVTQETDNNQSSIFVTLSNGKNFSIKIMPDSASETAIAGLGIKVCNESNNCTIVLKETGNGNETKAEYEVNASAQYRIFGIFKTKRLVVVDIDASTGNIIAVKKPWWSFLATKE